MSGQDWTDDPTVAGWLATDTPDQPPQPSGPTATAYSDTGPHDVAPVYDDTPTETSTAPVRSGVRGGGDDPTEQFPAPQFDTAPPVPSGHQSARTTGAAPALDPVLGVTVPAAAPTRRGRGHRIGVWASRYRWPLGGVAAAVLAVIVGVAVIGGGNDDAATPAAAGQGIVIPSGGPTSTAAPAAGNADCPTTTTGPVSTGRDAGGTDSGPNVIKAFEHAYYSVRSGAQARALVTPTADFATAAQLQTSIDQKVDPDALHCVSITDRGAGTYAVDLTVVPPRGETPTTSYQTVQTTTDRVRTWIVSIKRRCDAQHPCAP